MTQPQRVFAAAPDLGEVFLVNVGPGSKLFIADASPDGPRNARSAIPAAQLTENGALTAEGEKYCEVNGLQGEAGLRKWATLPCQAL